MDFEGIRGDGQNAICFILTGSRESIAKRLS